MHYLQAIIGPAALLAKLKQFPSSVICELPQGFALVPITRPVAAEMNGAIALLIGKAANTQRNKVEGLDELIAQLSMAGKVGYIETDYFGGRGGQKAEVWLDGKSIFDRSIAPGDESGWPNTPISQALRLMGVTSEPGKDEFDTLGLGVHRSTEKWAEPPKTDISTKLKAGRGPYAKVHIGFKEVKNVKEVAYRFGLTPESEIYFEVGFEDAKLTLTHLLHKDMAYEHEIMPLAQASILAAEFLAEFSSEEARYFTNSDWPAWLANPGSGRSWAPATDATFDSGILIITPTRVGCAWFMDED